MDITVPSKFKLVDWFMFDEYLKWCPDYTRDSIGFYDVYKFRHGHRFAYVHFRTGQVWVDPDLLKSTE